MRSETAFKKIGIVGGVAWPSTITYYSEICRRAEQFHSARNLAGAPTMPEMIIESLDLNKAISYIGRDEDESSWSHFDHYHRAALQNLQACGAEVAVMASNTPHHRFDSIIRGIGIPVISILQATAKQSALIEARQVLILGTALTMTSSQFREGFASFGIQALGPQDEATRSRTVQLITQLQLGRREGAAAQVRDIAFSAFQAQFPTRPVVCLACTELALAFEAHKHLATFECDDIVYINTTAVHINAVFDFAAPK